MDVFTNMYFCVTIFFRVVVRPDTIYANCRHKLLCHFNELLVIAICKGAAIVITQVVDTIPYLYDGYCTIRVTAVNSNSQARVGKIGTLVPGVLVVVGHFSQLLVALHQISSIGKELRWSLFFKLLRKDVRHKIGDQVISVLCHFNAPDSVVFPA